MVEKDSLGKSPEPQNVRRSKFRTEREKREETTFLITQRSRQTHRAAWPHSVNTVLRTQNLGRKSYLVKRIVILLSLSRGSRTHFLGAVSASQGVVPGLDG